MAHRSNSSSSSFERLVVATLYTSSSPVLVGFCIAPALESDNKRKAGEKRQTGLQQSQFQRGRRERIVISQVFKAYEPA